ncbi:MAG: bifunctional phosphopantothenoylcysteine decarboxylase/phosphopantothenate--cysteine ligase CoaBC [Sphingobacteriaceae bacterium]
MLKDKNILLGVCGGIAAYKSALLVRLLVKAGAHVQVIMTKDATNFITPLTLSTLSKNSALINYFKSDTGEWNNHVDLGLWADLFIIAPLSANTMAKFAHGLCDNLLTAVYLSAKCPVYFAPAMDLDMWKHPATKQNVTKLVCFGNKLIEPTYGELASGLIGEGRMAEPEIIIEQIAENFKKKTLSGKKVLVTAGPTYEAIDPVRFIGNYSSGKMGYALAEELASLGAEVTLISGPTSLSTSLQMERIDVVSADEMFAAVQKVIPQSDIVVMCAAVADYHPKEVAREKLKKDSDEINISLVKTIDIIATVGKHKKKGQVIVGFALETSDEEAHAIKKLESKNLDLIILNSLRDEGAGFKGDTNKVTIIDRNHHKEYIELKSKSAVAKDICRKIVALCSLSRV